MNKLNRDLNNAHSHGSHVLVRLTYISRAMEGLSSEDLEKILEQARINNMSRGITGILIFNRHFFLQAIEGARPVINDLLNALAQDMRHSNLQLVSCIEIKQRKWSEWSMNYVSPNHFNRSLMLKYSTRDSFNPYLMDAAQIQMLIEDVSESLHVQQNKEVEAPKSGFMSLFRKAP